MKRRPKNIWFGTLFVLLALMSLLLAPAATFSHAKQTVAQTSTSDQHQDGCCDHQPTSQPNDDDCCSSSACSCACHAPLLTSMAFPPTPLVIFEQPRETTHRLPLVYQTIFVPPQNRS